MKLLPANAVFLLLTKEIPTPSLGTTTPLPQAFPCTRTAAWTPPWKLGIVPTVLRMAKKLLSLLRVIMQLQRWTHGVSLGIVPLTVLIVNLVTICVLHIPRRAPLLWFPGKVGIRLGLMNTNSPPDLIGLSFLIKLRATPPTLTNVISSLPVIPCGELRQVLRALNKMAFLPGGLSLFGAWWILPETEALPGRIKPWWITEPNNMGTFFPV